jgi:hypothetical protein
VSDVALTTKELSTRTWDDFVRFFSAGNGWDFCMCNFWQVRPPTALRSRADRQAWNLETKADLVDRGDTNGILVYDGRQPVGWCQFGRAADLMAGDVRAGVTPAGEVEWRVTCFCVDKAYRGRDVSGIALRGAIAAIANAGGGCVEAYPVATLDRNDPATAERFDQVREWYRVRGQLIDARDKGPAWQRHLAAEPHFEVDVGVAEPAIAWHHPDRQLPSTGTVALFEREGFDAVRILSQSKRARSARPQPSRVVVQKRLDA